MKKIKLLFAFILISTAASAQGLFSYIDLSSQFMESLNKHEFEKAHAMFEDSLQTKVTPQALEKVWTQLHAQLGDFQSVGGAQNRSNNEFQSAIINFQFEKGEQPFQFVFSQNLKLLGFFLAPKSVAASYKLPTYADTASYTEKMVTIKSGKHELAGVLTLPKSGEKFPVVVFVHGSGPSDMDETVGANKPFKDLATGLTSQGIASLRYVKRTMVYANEFQDTTFTLKEETEEDALSAVAFAKNLAEVNPDEIYVFGHSLGGMVAPRLASNSSDIKGIILAAAPARSLAQISVEQNQYMYQKSGDTTAATKKLVEDNIALIKKTEVAFLKDLPADSVILNLPVSYWRDVNGLQQVSLAKKLKSKILVLQGGNDFQVPASELSIWQNALKNKKNAQTKLYPMLNHLFVFVSEKGTMNQYYNAGNVDAVVVNDIAEWIKPKND